MFSQSLLTKILIKIPCVQSRDGNLHPVFQILQLDTAHIERLITDNLRRRKFINLIEQLCGTVRLSYKIISG